MAEWLGGIISGWPTWTIGIFIVVFSIVYVVGLLIYHSSGEIFNKLRKGNAWQRNQK